MYDRVMLVQHASGWCVLLHGFLQGTFIDEQAAFDGALAHKAEREANGRLAALVVQRRPVL